MNISKVPNSAPLGKRMQLGHVVSDLDAALNHWISVMGVGPFVVFEKNAGERRFYHRGQVSPVDFALAISFMGGVMIELILPLSTAPSPYSEFLGSGRQGLHHIGMWPADFEKTCEGLEAQGFVEVSSLRRPDGSKDMIYCDAPEHMGVMIEFADMTPLRERFLGGIKALADNWDGTRPVRRYADRAAFVASGEGQT